MVKKIILITVLAVFAAGIAGGIYYYLTQAPEESEEPEQGQETEDNAEEPENTVDESEAYAQKDEEFFIALESNPTTGYEWRIDFDESFIQLTKREYKPESNLIGAGGEETFYLKALQAGETIITFSYLRSWENVSPIDSRVYKVHVTE